MGRGWVSVYPSNLPRFLTGILWTAQKNAWVRLFPAQDSIRACVDLNTCIFICARGIGGRERKNQCCLWLNFWLCFTSLLPGSSLTSRHCRTALLHSFCVGLSGFFSRNLGLAYYFCFFSVFFSLFPSSSFFSLLRLSQTESLDGFLWFLCCLSLQDSGWAGPMKCFPKPKSCNNFLVFPQKNYDFYRLADLKGVFKIMKKKCTC